MKGCVVHGAKQGHGKKLTEIDEKQPANPAGIFKPMKMELQRLATNLSDYNKTLVVSKRVFSKVFRKAYEKWIVRKGYININVPGTRHPTGYPIAYQRRTTAQITVEAPVITEQDFLSLSQESKKKEAERKKRESPEMKKRRLEAHNMAQKAPKAERGRERSTSPRRGTALGTSVQDRANTMDSAEADHFCTALAN
ncbi:hypothetical protein AAFF_G00044960 [Aldrovandia affinis]|uniref:Uncharacterized protein n=1 Tax=Aldrovandia affinis TaxID=143900 RepID=A0AAD7S1Y1_9TELE|nr:hypothetical protein AAFF_G00044960 [Aldrovandia affinis]